MILYRFSHAEVPARNCKPVTGIVIKGSPITIKKNDILTVVIAFFCSLTITISGSLPE